MCAMGCGPRDAALVTLQGVDTQRTQWQRLSGVTVSPNPCNGVPTLTLQNLALFGNRVFMEDVLSEKTWGTVP
jgi:hypothetical protein